MTEEELKALKKEVSQKKRIATEWASQIHDLVEDRLLIDYRQLPELATQAHRPASTGSRPTPGWKLPATPDRQYRAGPSPPYP